MFFGVACVVSMWVTFRPKHGLQAWFMRTHQMVKAENFPWYLEGATWRSHTALGGWGSYTAGLLRSVNSSLFQKQSLNSNPQWQLFLSPKRTPWGFPETFQYRWNTQARTASSKQPAIILLIELKGHSKWCLFRLFGYQQPHQIASLKNKNASLAACLLVTWSFKLSKCFPLHFARLVSIPEACNSNLPRIHLPDGYR